MIILALALYYRQRLGQRRLEQVLGDHQWQARLAGVSPDDVEMACNRVRARTGLTCLPVALSMRHVLRASGQDARLVLGVAPENFGDGHAWIELEGHEYLRGTTPRRVAWREHV